MVLQDVKERKYFRKTPSSANTYLIDCIKGDFTISGKFHNKEEDRTWVFSGVYGSMSYKDRAKL